MSRKQAQQPSPHLEKLRSLTGDPEAQARFAATLLEPKAGLEAIRAALAVLIDWPFGGARPGLVRLYDHFAANNGVRDAGAYTRSLILRALRPVAEPDDRALLARALTTYEFPPPAFREECAMLRAVALAALADLDDRLAVYHATRLMADEHTDSMSGEPALTAIGLLAALEEWLPMYFYVMQPEERMMPEAAAEALRRLVALPEELLPHLVERLRTSKHAILLVGLFDLLIQYKDGPRHVEFLAQYLGQCDEPNMYRYLATALAAAGKPLLLEALLEEARFQQQRVKVQILVEVLEVIKRQPGVEEVYTKLKARMNVRQ